MSQTGLTVSEREGVTVVDFRAAAVLDADVVDAVSRQLYALVDRQSGSRVLLDLSAVRFLASRMIGTIVTLHKKTVDAGGGLVVCGLAANLMRVFEIACLDQVLRFAPDAEGGLRMLTRAAGEPAPPSAAPPEGASPRGWGAWVQRQVRILFAGAMVLVPLAITAWVVWSVGSWLDGLGRQAFHRVGAGFELPHGTGAILLVAVIYLAGLLTHLWLFRGLFGLLERLLVRLPGVKTIYESVRDLLRFFGGDSRHMGRVVQYNLPGTDLAALGILTNENPLGVAKGRPQHKVAVYLPYSYMLGGPTVFVSPEHLVEVDMSVEQCMKLCATAQMGTGPIVAPPRPAGPARQPKGAKGGEAS